MRSVAQPCVLQPVASLGRALTFRLEPEVLAGAALQRVRDAFVPSWGVLGVGEPLVRALGRSVAGLRTFPALSGVGHSAPSTQHALWVMLQGEDRGTLFDRARVIAAAAAPDLVLVDALDTFRYAGGRDLTGYEDGTENPKADAAEQAAIIGHGAVSDAPMGHGAVSDLLRGGSFVAVQRWVHDLARFASFPRERRDASVGRSLDTNEELADAPSSAHVKRTAQESFEPPTFMVRRSMPWATGHEQGLEFIAYGESLDRFERQLVRMLGLEDGIVDALFDFSRPVTGSYYFCPPITGDRLDLRALGV